MQLYGNATSAYPMPDAPPQRDTIGTVVSEMDNELERLHKLRAILERIGEHLEGPVPQQAGGEISKLDTSPHSLLDNLRRKHRSAQVVISQCENAATRVCNALGI